MASGYFERYLAGEREAVWAELIALGEAAYDGPLLEEALRVCDEIVRRAVANLRTLHGRLTELGYAFLRPDFALRMADDKDRAAVARLEAEWGQLPLIGRAWYRTVASADFRQADGQLGSRTAVRLPPPPADVYGLGSHPVLVFRPIDEGRAQYEETRAEYDSAVLLARGTEAEPYMQPWDRDPFLPLGGVASNCELKAFQLPGRAVDGVIYNDGGGDRYFVDELREAFRWGGFPFWHHAIGRPEFYAILEYRPAFERLLPVLREGLVEL